MSSRLTRIKHRLIRVAVLAVSLTVASCSNDTAPSALDPGYQQYKGQWLVINYWATWCKPCLREIPELSELNHDESNVTVFALNFDGVEGEELDQLHQQMGIDYPVAPVDPKHHYGFKTPSALPTTVIIRPDGELHKILLGEQSKAKLLAAMTSE